MRNLIKATLSRRRFGTEQLPLSCPFVNYSTGRIKNANKPTGFILFAKNSKLFGHPISFQCECLKLVLVVPAQRPGGHSAIVAVVLSLGQINQDTQGFYLPTNAVIITFPNGPSTKMTTTATTMCPYNPVGNTTRIGAKLFQKVTQSLALVGDTWMIHRDGETLEGFTEPMKSKRTIKISKV